MRDATGALAPCPAPRVEGKPGDRRPSFAFDCMLVAGLVVLGAILRLYRLGDQSIWIDEYPNVLYLDAPNLHTYLLMLRLYLPEQGQAWLYYIILYYVGQCVGDSVLYLRIVSVAFGLMPIPLLYILARHLAGRRAGLIAALCLALSPQHIWYSQEIRPSPLVAPLVLLSLIGIVRAVREDKYSWIWLSLSANVLLLWTHLFLVLLLPVEAVLLAFHLRRRFAIAALWVVAHSVVLVPWSIGILRMPASYTDEFRDAFVSLGRAGRDIFLDDVVSANDHLLPAWKTSGGSAVTLLNETLLPLRPWMDGLLIAGTLLALVWFAADMARRALRTRRSHSGAGRMETGDGALVCALLIGPASILALANWLTGRPFLAPNYTLFSSIGMYVIWGSVLARIQWKTLRAAFIGFLVLLYGFQLALLLPDTTRSDWLSASKHLTAHASPQDLVLECEYFWPNEFLAYYLRGTDFSAERVTSFHDAYNKMDRFLRTSGNESQRAWIFFERSFIDWLYPAHDMTHTLEAAAAARNLSCRHTAFPGHYNVACVEVRLIPGSESVKSPPPVPAFDGLDFVALAQRLAPPGLTEDALQELEEGLRRRLPFWPPSCKFFLVVHVLDAVAHGDLQTAEALARHATAAYPDFSLAHFALGLALLSQRETDSAAGEFERAYGLDPGVREIYGPLTDALCAESDPAMVRQEIERLHALHVFSADTFDTFLPQ